jgi:MFS family permease
MWLQAVAIVLPRVQQHYSVPDNYIGIVSSTMFAGMMLGAVGWGTCSDLIGRSTAFNATLFFTALFGVLASFSWSYSSLCVLLFFLGTAVGVSATISPARMSTTHRGT